MPVPLVPVKALADAKGRLAPFLSPIERRLLVLAMFEDVVAALQAVPGLDRPVVVSPDREVRRRAEAIGCRVVEDRAPDLNAALAAAAAGLGGAGTLLAVAADLPLASAAALGRVLTAAGGTRVALAPSRDGVGTNVLAWPADGSVRPSFGPGSAGRHLAVPGAVRVDEPVLALDVDTVDDLRDLAAAPELDPGSVTGRHLRDLRLAERLAATG